MANIRNLKKDINYVMGDIIDAVYIWEFAHLGKSTAESEAIIDEAIATYDELIAKVNQKNVDDKKAHFKAINAELEERALGMVEKINALS